LAAERTSEVGRLALLQQDNADKKQANNDVDDDEKDNHAE
jgi:hypothetical protein